MKSGYVGRIIDGKFEYLFSVHSPDSEEVLKRKRLQPFTFKDEDVTDLVTPVANKGAITKRTRRAFIVRHTESIDQLSKMFEQRIRKTRNFGTKGERRALLVVDKPEYKRIPAKRHEAARNWLNNAKDAIRYYLDKKKIQLREDEELHLGKFLRNDRTLSGLTPHR